MPGLHGSTILRVHGVFWLKTLECPNRCFLHLSVGPPPPPARITSQGLCLPFHEPSPRAGELTPLPSPGPTAGTRCKYFFGVGVTLTCVRPELSGVLWLDSALLTLGNNLICKASSFTPLSFPTFYMSASLLGSPPK